MVTQFMAPADSAEEKTMDRNPVSWFEIYVQDMNRAKRFYESVFQAKLERLNSPNLEMWAFPMRMERIGASGALVRTDGVPSGGNSTLVYFHSHDCSVEVSRVVESGGRIHRGKMSIGQYGFVALAYDTEGNLFGVHSMK